MATRSKRAVKTPTDKPAKSTADKVAEGKPDAAKARKAPAGKPRTGKADIEKAPVTVRRPAKGRGRGSALVIVESPTKAKTIGKYLGAGYDVRATIGHLRDLPTRELGVDVERGFEPKYVTIK